MTLRHGGQILVDQLKAQGVRRVFSVPGESFLAALDGLHESGIENIVCRHEGGGRDDGRSPCQADRAAGRCLCHARAGGHERVKRHSCGQAGFDAAYLVRGADRHAPPRPRGIPRGRLPRCIRAACQMGGRSGPDRPIARIYQPCLSCCAIGPPRPGGAGAARKHAIGARRCARFAARRPPCRPLFAASRSTRFWTCCAGPNAPWLSRAGRSGRRRRHKTWRALPKGSACRCVPPSGGWTGSTTATRITRAICRLA